MIVKFITERTVLMTTKISSDTQKKKKLRSTPFPRSFYFFGVFLFVFLARFVHEKIAQSVFVSPLEEESER
jgi:hypothetical protein